MTTTISIVTSIVLATGATSLARNEDAGRDLTNQARIEWANVRSRLPRRKERAHRQN